MPSKSKSFGRKAASQVSNPFQQKWAKSNQTLLRKRSQSAAFAKQSGRNVFRDRRIGESDPNLDDENRYLCRLQRERTKRVRSRVRFSLADDDNPDDELGTGSLKLPSLPLEEDGVLSEQDEEDSIDGSEDGEELMKLKQPNNEGNENKDERTRQDIMNEVVQKSKMYKAQRQHEKYVANEQTAKLDENLPELIEMLAQSSAEYEKRKPKLSLSLKNKPQTKAIFDADGTTTALDTAQQAFHYDDVYRQLANEKRARPSERLLTEEEKAERERDRLIELEKQRKSRMESMDDTDEDLEDENQNKRGKKRRRDKGGDDLDDDFDFVGSGEGRQLNEKEGIADTDGENDNSDEDDTEKRNEEYTETPESFWQAVDRQSLAALETGGTEDVPFVFKKCPRTSAELQQLMAQRTVEQRELILDRIQKCFAESLNAGRNRPKLERLVECILFRIERLSELDSTFLKSGISEIDKLLKHVHRMGQKFEHVVSRWSKRKLFDLHRKIRSPDTCLSVAWKTSDIVVARAIGRLYPSSDVRHPVATPLALLLSEAISMRRISCIADVALGIFVTVVLLEVVTGREGYSGELGNFVYEVVLALCPESEVSRPGKLKGMFRNMMEGNNEETQSCLSMADYLEAYGKQDLSRNKRFQRKVAYAITGVVEGMNFSGQHRNWDVMLSGLPIEKLVIPETRDRLLNLMSQSRVNRVPLSLYAASRKPIVKALNPKYTAESGIYRKRPKTSFQSKMSGDISASAKRVQRALRKEERGLARDVRRDTQVVAATRAREQQVKDEERDRRNREVMSFLESQQATWKAAEKRQKKLSGKKW